MTPVRLRAEDVAQLLSALDRACAAAPISGDDYYELVKARSFVRVYLMAWFDPLLVAVAPTAPEDTNV